MLISSELIIISVLNNNWEQVATKEDLQNFYSLRDGIEIPKNADLKSNTYLVPGNYYCPENMTASTLSNCPVNRAFLLKVEYSIGTANSMQTFRTYDGDTIIIRTYDTGLAKWLPEYSYVQKNDLTNIYTEYNVANNNVLFRCTADDGSAIQLATTGIEIQLQKRTSDTEPFEVVWAK